MFLPLDGVTQRVGYVGGEAATATYEAVCSGTALGNAEAIAITFELDRLSFGQILRVRSPRARPDAAEPTGTRPRHADRSAIFPQDDEQRAVAAAYIGQLDAAHAFPAPIVTTIEPAQTLPPPRAITRTTWRGIRSSRLSRRVKCCRNGKLRRYFPTG
ncbi:MAG: peptide-methionine (S)-S-oxide reductase [Candidatus Binatia bacterium]